VVAGAADLNSTWVPPPPVELLGSLARPPPPAQTRAATTGAVPRTDRAVASPPAGAVVDMPEGPARRIPAQTPLQALPDAHGFLAGQCG
jgi:hypothetical protein